MKLPLLFIIIAALALPCEAKLFDQTLDGGGFSVRVKVTGPPGKNAITITPKGLKKSNDPITISKESQVARAFLLQRLYFLGAFLIGLFVYLVLLLLRRSQLGLQAGLKERGQAGTRVLGPVDAAPPPFLRQLR